MFCLPGIVGLITFIFVRPQEIFPVLEKVPFLYLFCALVLFGLAVDLKLRLIKPVPTPALIWGLLFLVLVVISTVVKSPPETVKPKIIFIFVSFLLFFSISQGVQSFKTLQVIAGSVAILSLFLTLVAIHQGSAPTGCLVIDPADPEVGTPDGRDCQDRIECYGVDAEPGAEYMCEHIGLFETSSIMRRVRWRGVLRDPNELAMTIACGFALLIGFATARRSRLRSGLAMVATVLVLIALIGTQSRGGQLVFLGVLGVYFVKRFGWKGIALGAVLAMPVMMMGGRSSASADMSAMQRLEAWRHGLEMLMSNPLFGVGHDLFAVVHERTAHNSYVLIFGELGMPGFFLWTTMLYMSVKTLIAGNKRFANVPAARIAQVWAMALLAAMVGMMVGITFLSFSYHNVLWIYLGMCGAYYSAAKSHDPEWQVRFGLKDAALIVTLNIGYLILLAIYLRLKHV